MECLQSFPSRLADRRRIHVERQIVQVFVLAAQIELQCWFSAGRIIETLRQIEAAQRPERNGGFATNGVERGRRLAVKKVCVWERFGGFRTQEQPRIAFSPCHQLDGRKGGQGLKEFRKARFPDLP